ncbi:Shikimate kinase [Bienertia sinuspersici]
MGDAKGNTALVSGTILPIDVWSNNGVKYFIEFNGLCQPIRKGGHILIRFISMMAKMETHCLVGEEDWHAIDNHIKGKIVTDIRESYHKTISVCARKKASIFTQISKYRQLYKKNDKLEKKKEKLKDQVQENNFLFKTLIGQFSQVLSAVRQEKSSPELLNYT